MKKPRYLFAISFLITSCVLGGFIGVCAAYENIIETSRGEYRRAVHIDRDEIRILDYVYKIKTGSSE